MTHDLSHQAKTTEINGVTYTVEPLGFVTGRKTLVRLGNLFGTALGALAQASGPTSLESLTGALGDLLRRISDEDLGYFEEVFKGKSRVRFPDGKEPLVTDLIKAEYYATRYAEYFQWLVFAIQTSYADFFADALAAVKRNGALGLATNP